MNENLINSFSLVGNIASVNEIKEQSNGNKYRYISICQNNKYKDKNGDIIDKPNFYGIKIYEKHFKNFENNLNIGKFVNIFGKINVYKGEDSKVNLTLVGTDSRSMSKEKLPEIYEYDWLNEGNDSEIDYGI